MCSYHDSCELACVKDCQRWIVGVKEISQTLSLLFKTTHSLSSHSTDFDGHSKFLFGSQRPEIIDN